MREGDVEKKEGPLLFIVCKLRSSLENENKTKQTRKM